MFELSLVFGALVGLSLGLTGGGGSIFAVPLLVYGLSIAPREAIGVSLASVGTTALVGFLWRLRKSEIDLRTGSLFAVSGVLGAPLGTTVGGRLSDDTLLVLFSIVMLVVAARMWSKESAAARELPLPSPGCPEPTGPACRRDGSGTLRLNSRCAVVLFLAGIATGVFSGLFGVGGGFLIVPALVFFSSLDIRRAAATSLYVIALTSASGVLSYTVSGGQALDPNLTILFSVGGVLGLFSGMLLAARLSGLTLRRVFSVSMVLVAAFTVTKTTVS